MTPGLDQAGLWRDRISGLTTGQGLSSLKPTGVLDRWFRVLGKIDRLLQPVQPTRFRRILSGIACLPGVRPMVLTVARLFRSLPTLGGVSQAQTEEWPKCDGRPLDVRIIESSRAMIFLCDHAKSLIAPEYLAMRPTHVVPLYARSRGVISAEKKAELRRKYAVPESAFVVTTTGFQTRMKLTDRFVQACAELGRFEGAPVYVQMLGQFLDQTLEEWIRSFLNSGEVNAFVSEGFVDEEILTERVALSDVAVFLRGWTTGGPSAGLNDVLGMGIPCLVTDDFAFREYPKTAVLRVANTEVTEGLVLLYRDPAVRESLAAGGLRYAQDLSVERVGSKLCEVFSRYEPHGSNIGSEHTSGGGAGKAMPHVFVDLTYGLMHKVRSGLQRVEREIASGLRELDPNAKHFTFVAWDKDSRQFRLVSVDRLKERDTLPPMETWLAECPVVDILDGAHLFLLGSNWPLGDSYFAEVVSLGQRGTQLSVLIPDLIPLRHRWSFYAHHPERTTIDLFRTFFLRVVPWCRNVLTISNYTMADIQTLLVEMGGVLPQRKDGPKLHVLKLGADWTTPFIDGEMGGTSVGEGGWVENPYILFVSTLEKRKNHERLIDAFSEVRKRVENVDLVLVGHVDGSIANETLEFIERSAWIHHWTSLDDAMLRRLYEGCLFTVFPSLDEGYGLPVIESFRYGKFCLAANAGAIPEAGGIFADYFDPYDVRMLAEKILTYVTNPLELEKRVALVRSYRPTSWRSTARQVAEIFYGDAVVLMRGAREEG